MVGQTVAQQSKGEAVNRIEGIENGNGTAAFEQLLNKASSISVYDKISDPLVYVEKMGEAFARAGVAGCTKPAEGVCLAWALMEMRMNWIQFSSEYHMVQGKPTLQAHVILARIRKAGGDVEWINDGDNLIESRAKFTISNRTTELAYTMATAKTSGVVKKDGNWEKSPAAMLRAALMRKAAKMLCPEVLTGDVDPEEFSSNEAAPATAAPVRSQAEIEKRRQELESEVKSTVSAVLDHKAEEAPFDAAVELPATTTNTATTDKTAEANEHTVVLLEIEATIGEAGMTKAQLEAGLKAKNPAFTSLDDLPLENAKALLENVRAKLAKK